MRSSYSNTAPPSVVPELLAARRTAHGDAIAITGTDASLTWFELSDRVDQLASVLIGLKLGPRARVIIAVPAGATWAISTLATMQAGLTAVPVDPKLPAGEASRMAELVQPALVITTTETCDSVRASFNAPCLRVDPDLAESRDLRRRSWNDYGDVQPHTPALMILTSGTTGQPKAAVHCQRTLVLAGEGFASWIGLDSTDRIFVCLPLFHVNAIFYSFMGALATGASVDFAERFSVSRFWSTVKATAATEVNLMGPMLKMLLTRANPADSVGHTLRTVYSSGASPAVHQRFEETFQVRVIEGYGLTETPYGCINGGSERRLGSLGKPRHHPAGLVTNDVRVISEDGAPLGPNQLGQIVIKNNAMFQSYWGDHSATRAAFTPDGWLLTRDLGTYDEDGYFWFHGRMGDVIRRAGVNVSPTEIEQLLMNVDGVENVGVVGLPDDIRDSEIVVATTLSDTAESSVVLDRLREHSAEVLSREKQPDCFVVLDRLPVTQTGRVRHSQLRDLLIEMKGGDVSPES